MLNSNAMQRLKNEPKIDCDSIMGMDGPSNVWPKVTDWPSLSGQSDDTNS